MERAAGEGTFAAQRFSQLIKEWSQQENRFLFRSNTIQLELTVVAEDIIRFRYTPEERFEPDFSYAIDLPARQAPECDFHLEEQGDQFHLHTPKLKCVISRTLHVTLLDQEGQVLLEDERGYYYEPHPVFGGNIVYCSKKIRENEMFFGLGDKAERMNMRGLRFEIWGSDRYGFERNSDPLYKNIPFYTGLSQGRAYGIFFDNSFRTRFDFGFERSDVATFWAKGGEMNYYFIYGPELRQVSERYTFLTGTPELPPLWALGFHQSRWSYFPEEKVKSLAETFREMQIPCDVIHLDIDYMDGYRCFTWDNNRFPDPATMNKTLEALGIKTVAIIDPGIKIEREYALYQEGEAKGYFCRRADGPLMRGEVWPGECHFPDFTDPRVRRWWAGLFKEFMKSGVRGVWTDMNEPAVLKTGTFPEDTRHDCDGHPCSHRKAHNVYGMQMARATLAGHKKASFPNRPFVISRSGYAGLQRYAAVWTGDNVATWEHLGIANIQCQRLSISGLSFCGSDVGGFYGDSNGELLLRWTQLGLLHPFFRIHSTSDHKDQEPWAFGEPWTSAIRKAIELRYQLLPYIYTAFWRYIQRGTPMLQPLVWLDQENQETWWRMDEFSLGGDLLSAPITESGATSRMIYLPSGRWYDYWTGEVFEGRQDIEVKFELDTFPLFVREGTMLPHFPVQQYVGEKKFSDLEIRVYFKDGEAISELYEDAGDFYDYEQGSYSVRNFALEGTRSSLTISQTQEGRFNPSYRRFRLVIYGLPFQPAGMIVDGETSMFDPDTGTGRSNGAFHLELDKTFERLQLLRLDHFSE